MKRIVYTRADGGVSICCPASQIMRAMCAGGFWLRPPRGFVADQIERKIARGMPADAARRLCRALVFGGLTTGEAYAVIRDADCHLGTAHDLYDVGDLPADRTYRNAWRRSHNGGPIYLDERKVLEIDEHRAWLAYERGAPHNRHRGELGASW